MVAQRVVADTVREPSAVQVVPVAYGRAAAAALHEQVALAKAGDPLAPVTVVVPSNYVGVAARRRLAAGEFGPVTDRGAGTAGVGFLTVFRLAELLGAPVLAGAGRRPVSTPVLGAALRACLAEQPGLFASVAGHPATEEAFVHAFRELADVEEHEAQAVASRSRRAADVVRLCAAARSRLAAAWYDEADLVGAATTAAATSPLTVELGTVVVYLPQEMTRRAAALLRVVSERTPVVVVAGRTGDAAADAGVRAVLGHLGADPAGFDEFAPTETDAAGAAEAGLEVVSTSDADDEVRAVVRRILDAVRAGTPLERIAVLYGSAEPYARLLHEQLGAAGVRFNGAAVRGLSERLAGRVLLEAIALEDAGYPRGDVLGLLTGAPVRLPDGAFPPSSAWQRVSREAGVVGGDDWDRRLRTLAHDLEAAAALEQASEDCRDWLVARHRREAAAALALSEFVGRLRTSLRSGRDLHTWAELAGWARALLTDLLGGEEVRRGWPLLERKAAEKVEGALDRLGGLDGIAGAPDLAVFSRTLELELDADLGRVGRLGEGVLVGGIGMGLGLDVDVVVVTGLAEGLLPSPMSEDTLLADFDRAAAPEALPSRDDRSCAQRRRLLAALASARTTCIASVPRGDLRARSEKVPSRWLLDAVEARTGRRALPEAPTDLADATWMRHVPSFAAGIARLDRPATQQEYRLRRLARATSPAGELADPVLCRAFDVLSARNSGDFTRFDGNLAGLGLTSPADGTVSATGLEGYVFCPHAHLLERVLRVAVVEDPEEVLKISSLDSGSIVHEVLERFVAEGIAAGTVPEPGQPWPVQDLERLDRIFECIAARYEARGRCGHQRFWRGEKARLRADLARFLTEDALLRASRRSHPIAVEFSFGHEGEPEVAVPLSDGRHLRFVGKVDRVDECEDGSVLVIDYKTGKSDKYRALCEADPDQDGSRLQLPAYGLAARAAVGRPAARVEARYWFVTNRGRFHHYGFEITDAVLARYRAVLDTIVAGIENGAFPSRPHPESYSGFVECAYCDPDRLGTADLTRAWQRKRHDPALAGLLALVEPESASVGEQADG